MTLTSFFLPENGKTKKHVNAQGRQKKTEHSVGHPQQKKPNLGPLEAKLWKRLKNEDFF